MSKSQYLEMCEQTGQDIDWDKCPNDWEDFPDVVLDAVSIYNLMGNKIYPEVGFIGKDFTNFNFLLKSFNISKHQKDFVYEIIIFMESRQIEISQRKLKAEYDKIKKK